MASLEGTVFAIKSLKIQGAMEVRKAAVRAIASEAAKSRAKSLKKFKKEMRLAVKRLYSSRPTEPELRTAMRILLHELSDRHESVSKAKLCLQRKCREYEKDRENALKRIAEIGAKGIPNNSTILTHCHSHSVIAVLQRAKRRGRKFNVICTESRPLFQGRLSAKDLCKAKIPVTMIVDSAVESVMRKVDVFYSGADAILADGSLVNKIGTATISEIAKKHCVPHIVVCSSHKFDAATVLGKEEVIEERDWREIWKEKPASLKIRNPAFDITSHGLVSEIISEKGVHSPEAFALLMYEEIVREKKDKQMASLFGIGRNAKKGAKE